jgi:channel protein, hemolysin III family
MTSAAVSRRERRSFLASLPKPKARGWIHAITAPLALANAIVLIALAPTLSMRMACLVFGISSVVLFGHSAVYHMGKWSPKIELLLKRMDHSNIFLLIAGTYTPLTVAMLEPRTAAYVLTIVWAGALGGISLAVFKPHAPRWLSTSLYLILGWIAVWFLPEYWTAGGPAVVWLILAGGIAYSVGAVFYGLRWPNPWPRIWGFHEFFHACTLLAYSCQVVAVWFVVMGVK